MYIRESSSAINSCRVFTYIWLTVSTILNRDRIYFTLRIDNVLQYSSIKRVLGHLSIPYTEVENKLLVNNTGMHLAPYEIGRIFNKKDIANGLLMWLNDISGNLDNNDPDTLENNLVRHYILEVMDLVTKYLYIDHNVDLKTIPIYRLWEYVSYIKWYNRPYSKRLVKKRCEYVDLHYIHIMLIIEICLTSYSSNRRLFKCRVYKDTAFYLDDVLRYISYFYKHDLAFEYKLVQVNKDEYELRIISASGALPSYYLRAYNTKEMIQVLNKFLDDYAIPTHSIFTSSYLYKCNNQLVLTYIEELFKVHPEYFSVSVDNPTLTVKITKRGIISRILYSFISLFKPAPIESEVLKHIKSRGNFNGTP